jgi:hypothetical protein
MKEASNVHANHRIARNRLAAMHHNHPLFYMQPGLCFDSGQQNAWTRRDKLIIILNVI